MKQWLLICLLLFAYSSKAQELYVYTEPASNMAAKSIGFRLNNNFMYQKNSNGYRYMLAPEIMAGVSKKIMLHIEGFLSNMNGDFKLNGGTVYAKYRFFSIDDVHSHFRMAAYMRGSISNLPIQQPAIDLLLMNSGVETGIVATQLIKRTAISTSVSHLYAADNANSHKFSYGNKYRNALSYTISAGRLMLPKEYTSYNQTNVNLMVEALGQTNLYSGKSFIDIAPSVQFIIKSQMRVDIGYRFAMINNLQRNSENGALLRLEYNIFNAF